MANENTRFGLTISETLSTARSIVNRLESSTFKDNVTQADIDCMNYLHSELDDVLQHIENLQDNESSRRVIR